MKRWKSKIKLNCKNDKKDKKLRIRQVLFMTNVIELTLTKYHSGIIKCKKNMYRTRVIYDE